MWTRIFRQISMPRVSPRPRTRDSSRCSTSPGQMRRSRASRTRRRTHFWRPQTAIQEAENDENPATHADPAWTSLLPTPPYPDHPSGHNCVSGSFVRTLQQFFGTNVMSFSATHSIRTDDHPELHAFSVRRSRRSVELGSSVGCTSGRRTRKVRVSAGGWRTGDRRTTSSRLPEYGSGGAPEAPRPCRPGGGGAESDRRHRGFQPRALPTELPPRMGERAVSDSLAQRARRASIPRSPP